MHSDIKNFIKKSWNVKDFTYIAMSAALISVCAWITVPMPVPFTMQTFGVFTVLLLLGGAKGSAAILVYILLGLVGLPVFSGFGAGAAVLFGPTGGYILGFLLTGLVYMLFEGSAKSRRGKLIVLAAGLFLCYVFGTVRFYYYMDIKGNAMSFAKCLSLCVYPFILPDTLKLLLASAAARRIEKALRKI